MPTTEQIQALEQEAAQAGDEATVHDCRLALGLEPGNERARKRARQRIAKVISNARAQQ
jgi:hypothetical protein